MLYEKMKERKQKLEQNIKPFLITWKYPDGIMQVETLFYYWLLLRTSEPGTVENAGALERPPLQHYIQSFALRQEEPSSIEMLVWTNILADLYIAFFFSLNSGVGPQGHFVGKKSILHPDYTLQWVWAGSWQYVISYLTTSSCIVHV